MRRAENAPDKIPSDVSIPFMDLFMSLNRSMSVSLPKASVIRSIPASTAVVLEELSTRSPIARERECSTASNPIPIFNISSLLALNAGDWDI